MLNVNKHTALSGSEMSSEKELYTYLSCKGK